MAYVTRPQYGVPVYEAPSTAPAGSQEPAHHNQNQKHDPIPGSSGASSPKPSHYHPDNTKIKAHDVQQHSYNPYRGYPELYRQDQAGSPQLRDHQEPKKVYSVEEHTHPSKEYYSPPGVGCQQSFSRPRLQQLSMSRLPFEMRFAQSYKEPKIPFPRSFSNEDYPQTSLGLQHGGQGYDGSFSVESKDGSGTSQICTNIVGSDGSGTSIPVRTEAKFKKPAFKERIVIAPSSPETISWDNPFPAFPTPKKKVPQVDNDSVNGRAASSNKKGKHGREGFVDQSPQPYESENNVESPLGNQQIIDTGCHREHKLKSPNHNSHQTNCANEIDQIHELEQAIGNRQAHCYPTAEIHVDSAAPIGQCRLKQEIALQPFGNRDDCSTSTARLHSITHNPRSRTMPNQISEALASLNFQVTSSNTSAYELPVNFPTPSTQCPNLDQVQAQELDRQLSSRQDSLIPHPKHSDLTNSYRHSANDTNFKPQHLAERKFLSPKTQEFSKSSNALQNNLHNHAITTGQDLHFSVCGPDHGNAPIADIHGWSGAKAVVPGFVGQAHRSRSQPYIKEQPKFLDQDHIFEFGNIPENPGISVALPQSNRAASQGREMHSSIGNSQDQRKAQSFNHHTHKPVPPADFEYAQGREHIPQVYALKRSYGNQPISHHQMGPTTPSDQYSILSQVSSASVQDKRMLPRQGRSPGNTIDPSKLSKSISSPSNCAYNPNTLPEHPAPVRPGLLQASAPNQLGKPCPIRQYEATQYPVQQSTTSIFSEPKALKQLGRNSGAVTHQELEKLRKAARTNPNDYNTQLALAKMMVGAANVLADDGGRMDQKQRLKNRERLILDAHKLVKKLVNSSYPEAMFYLADCYGRGLLGLETDYKEAFNLYQSAAKAGHPQSAYRVAVCCELGQEKGGGTRRDPLKAIQWYKRAATLGDTPAMYKLGIIQLKGLLGQPRNPKEALNWLKRAAERADEENPHALHELGLLFETASGSDNIIKDEAYSRELFTQAADLGYKFSQYRLGSAYEYGLLGCTVDPRQSITWYSRAAAQEEHQSELSLSGWYLTGSEGVLQQSDTEAYLWARKAAEAGLAKAEYAMGYFTEVGIGTSANIEDAKRWYWRAASQNFHKARERLEDLRKGGARMQKSRVSRSAVNKQSDGDCVIM